MAGFDPFFGTNPVIDGLEQRRHRVEQTRENSTRLAQAYASFDTQGVGEFKHPTVVTFGCYFVRRPVVSYGMSTDGDALIAERYPMAQGGVYGWQRNADGMYVGAWIMVVVQAGLWPTAVPLPPIDLTHDFTFTGVAMKALPAHLLEQ